MLRGRKPGTPKTGGRQKGTPNKATRAVKELAGEYGEEAVRSLVEIMRDGEAPPAARVAASREILDRAYGKVTQPIAGDSEMPPVSQSIRVLFGDS